MIRILRFICGKTESIAWHWGGRSTISHTCTTAITGAKVPGGIFDNAASSAEGSLLVDNLIIMLRWDAIMHCVSWLRSAVIYGQPVLGYPTTPWGEWEWIQNSGKSCSGKSADGDLSLRSTASAALSRSNERCGRPGWWGHRELPE